MLHPLPFIYILSAVGIYSLIEKFSRYGTAGKTLSYMFTLTVILYGMYIGFWEVRYFSLGSIRYHSQVWADQNLKSLCIKTHYGTFTPPSLCRNPSPCPLKADRGKDYKPEPRNIILKEFCLEKQKPLLHHLRGHKILVYVKKGNNFSKMPVIPAYPIPHLPTCKNHFVRFLNGINFNPDYNTRLLGPFRVYYWSLVSNSKIKLIKCLLINGNTKTEVRIYNGFKKIELLPFERKLIKIPLTSSFPWISPYLYHFNVRTHHGYVLFKLIPKQKNSENLNILLNPTYHFDKFFKKTYHYNSKYLQPFLKKKIYLRKVNNPVLTSLLFHSSKKAYENPCLLNKNPIFLERGGIYICEITARICLKEKSNICFYLFSLPETLGQIILTKQNLSHYKTHSPFTYKIRLPFKTKRDTMITFLATHQGEAFENILSITLKSDFYKIEKEKYYLKLVSRFITTHQSSFRPLDEKLDNIPCELIDSGKAFKIGDIYLREKDYKRAKKWFEIASSKNPINESYLLALREIYAKTGDVEKTRKINKRISSLQNFHRGSWNFETGLTLNAVRLPQSIQRGTKINVRMYLTLPAISGDQSAFFSFKRNRSFYFGKDFSLLNAMPKGDLYLINGTIRIPEKIPSGTYKVYFTYRIPKIDYRYHAMKNGKVLKSKSVFIEEVKID